MDSLMGRKPTTTNPKDQQAVSKVDLSVLPEIAIVWGNLAMCEGDYKYGAYNFRETGVTSSVYISALRRHLGKYLNGEWADKRTQVPHLGSIIACAAILADAHASGRMNDDRPIELDMEPFYDEAERITKHLQQLFPHPPGRFTGAKRQAHQQEVCDETSNSPQCADRDDDRKCAVES